MASGLLETYDSVSNDGEHVIAFDRPYVARLQLRGVAALIFHRYSTDAVEAKGKAKKNSAAKKEDDVESYVWRDDDGNICLPGEYLRQSIIHAAKFRQDPRSPRKSAMDLFKAGVVVLTELANLGSRDWDYLDRRRAVVQRNGITRVRPAFKVGWQAYVELEVLLPAYIDAALLLDVATDAGKLIGVGDFRPTYGRFQIVAFDTNQD